MDNKSKLFTMEYCAFSKWLVTCRLVRQEKILNVYERDRGDSYLARIQAWRYGAAHVIRSIEKHESEGPEYILPGSLFHSVLSEIRLGNCHRP